MDDQMIDVMAGNDVLRRRLEAYANVRLSPELATSSRLRARVLAVAHRQASLARADAALTVLPRPGGATGAHPSRDLARYAGRTSARSRHRRWQRAAGVVLAASLGAAMFVGGVSAARPGGPLYDTRLWAETLTLPGDPSARAVAELDRLHERLREIGEAGRSGDAQGAMAALAAYEAILEQASASAILAGDDVAAAVLEAGVGRNVEVLRALAARLPTNASAAVTRAIDAAIARSTDAVQRIGASRPGGGRDDGAGSGSPATPPGAPTAEPTPHPDSTAAPKPKATRKPTPEPAATDEPAATPEPKKTPDRTQKPRDNQGWVGPPASPGSAPGGNPQDESD